MGMAYGLLIIQPQVFIHFTEGPFMGPSSGQAVEGFHGVVVVAEYSVADEGFVDGSDKEWVVWRSLKEPMGINQNFLENIS
jgi:hypothetical protein